MENKKLTLEDLKLESFLTEIDNSKLVKVQGGNGAYNGDTETEPTGCGGDCTTNDPNDTTTYEPTMDSCGGCPPTDEPTEDTACCTTDDEPDQTYCCTNDCN